MFNIGANLNNPRYNLSSLAKDMGLGGRREKDAEEQIEAKSRVKRILGELSVDPKEEETVAPAGNQTDEISQARLLAAEQRKAAESLLLEARALEKQLLDETAHAHEARERAGEFSAAVARALAAEHEARERAAAAAERHALATNESKQIDAVLQASRRATEAATAEIAELKRRLEDVLKVATDASELMTAQEQRAVDAAAAVAAAEKDVSEANASVAQRQTEREAAERDAAAAKEKAFVAEKAVQAVVAPPLRSQERQTGDAA